jgi:hypothetical protein
MPQCKKVPYPNRKEAKAAMKRHNDTYEDKVKGIYRCPYCKEYHLTTMNKSDGKRQRKWHIINKNK